MACSLDGSNRGIGSGASLGVSLTCSLGNNVIFCIVMGNGTNAADAAPTVTSGPALTFTLRTSVNAHPFATLVYWAPSSSGTPFSGTITATQTNGASEVLIVDVFGVNGCANVSAPFDGTAVSLTGATFASYTTTNAHCLVYFSERDSIAAATVSGGGWTNIQSGNNNMVTGYQLTTVASTTLTGSSSSGTANGSIIDAVTSDGVAPPAVTLMGAICL